MLTSTTAPPSMLLVSIRHSSILIIRSQYSLTEEYNMEVVYHMVAMVANAKVRMFS